MKKKTAIYKLFKNISNLKESEEKYRRISIQRELGISELEAFPKKVAKAKEKNYARTDSEIYYVVRGTPNKYEIKTITVREEKQEGETLSHNISTKRQGMTSSKRSHKRYK